MEAKRVLRVCARCGATVFAIRRAHFVACVYSEVASVRLIRRTNPKEPSRIEMAFGDYELPEEIGRGGHSMRSLSVSQCRSGMQWN